jgi:hypothetical protein
VQYFHRLHARWERYEFKLSFRAFVRREYEEEKGVSIPRPPREPEARLIHAEPRDEILHSGAKMHYITRTKVPAFTLGLLVAWYEEGLRVVKSNEKRPAEAIAHRILRKKLISPEFHKPDTIPSAKDFRDRRRRPREA